VKPRCVGDFVAVGIFLFLWRPHVYIGKTCLGLQGSSNRLGLLDMDS
jgi:hypothetical protein